MQEQNNLDNFMLQGNINLQKAQVDYSYHENDILPIGSVVELENNPHRYMIIGHNYNSNNTNYLYIGCKYPDKIKDKCLCFQKENISAIVFIGMTSKEEYNYHKTL